MNIPTESESNAELDKGFEAAMTEHHDETLQAHFQIFAAGANWAFNKMHDLTKERLAETEASGGEDDADQDR